MAIHVEATEHLQYSIRYLNKKNRLKIKFVFQMIYQPVKRWFEMMKKSWKKKIKEKERHFLGGVASICDINGSP